MILGWFKDLQLDLQLVPQLNLNSTSTQAQFDQSWGSSWCRCLNALLFSPTHTSTSPQLHQQLPWQVPFLEVISSHFTSNHHHTTTTATQRRRRQLGSQVYSHHNHHEGWGSRCRRVLSTRYFFFYTTNYDLQSVASDESLMMSTALLGGVLIFSIFHFFL